MRWLALIVACVLLMGLAGWLAFRPDVVDGHGHLSPRLQQQATH
jgi:hypothetical protein